VIDIARITLTVCQCAAGEMQLAAFNGPSPNPLPPIDAKISQISLTQAEL